MNEKINFKEILEKFVQKNGLSEEQSKNFIDTFQYVFLQAIEQDKIVKIGGLGTFQLVWNKPRKSVDVRTQQEIEIAGHYKLTFTPENALKERVNAEFAHLAPKELDLGQPESKKDSPIEKLSQQAKDLKAIIDDMQQDSNKVEEIVEKVVEKIIEEPNTSALLSNQEEIKEEEIIKVETEDFPSEQVEEIVEVETEDFPSEQVKEIVEVETENFPSEQIEEIIIEEPKIEEKTEDASEVVRRVREMFEGKSVEVPNISTAPSNQEEIKEEKIVEVKTENVTTEQVKEVIVETENFLSEKIEEPPAEQPTEQPAETEAELDEKELAQKQSAIDFFYQKPEPPIEVKASTFDYIEDYDFKPKKRRCWLWWLIILLVLAAAATAFYFLKPNLAKKYWNYSTEKATELTQKIGGWFSKPQTADIEPDTIPADTIKIDLDTISQFVEVIKTQPAEVAKTQPVEVTKTKPVETQKTPEKSIFNEPRNYKEFIKSVTMYGGSTLVKLAEEHYGHKVFWVYIYEANKNKIADPNKISAGQVVKIPKLNKKLIDPNNPACLEYAQGLHDEYLKK